MSLIGPRPLLEKDLLLMKKTEPEFYFRRTKLLSMPGLTGCWQIYGNRTKGSENLIELDEYYENQKSFLFDAKIFLNSIFIVMTASHSGSIIYNRKENKKIVSLSAVLTKLSI